MVIREQMFLPTYGIYADGYWGINYAKSKNLRLFVGVGMNIFNSYDYNELKNLNIKEISASKEISERDIDNISKNLHVLSFGENVIMNLAYCPFDKKCSNCLYKPNTFIKDESNRTFKLFRYKISECRFALFNCMGLLTKNEHNNEIFAIFDESENYIDKVINQTDFSKRKELLKNHTYGNYVKGVL